MAPGDAPVSVEEEARGPCDVCAEGGVAEAVALDDLLRGICDERQATLELLSSEAQSVPGVCGDGEDSAAALSDVLTDLPEAPKLA